jgi:hypothetical protein
MSLSLSSQITNMAGIAQFTPRMVLRINRESRYHRKDDLDQKIRFRQQARMRLQFMSVMKDEELQSTFFARKNCLYT